MNDLNRTTAAGCRIERESFALIDSEVGPHPYSASEWQVVRRVIHTTADFDFARSMVFGPGSVEAGVAALKRGAPVISDVRMIAAGLSHQRLSRFGSAVHCFIDDEEVLRSASQSGHRTRAAESMLKAHRAGLLDGSLIAIGNAPTALAEVQRLVGAEGINPALVIGVPVGFVGAAESKEAALELPVPHIVSRGRKGGSPVAVAVVHALLALATAEGGAR